MSLMNKGEQGRVGGAGCQDRAKAKGTLVESCALQSYPYATDIYFAIAMYGQARRLGTLPAALSADYVRRALGATLARNIKNSK